MATIAADTRPRGRSMTGEEIKVITASSAGTIFEWYDFYLYGSLAAVIGAKFFSSFDVNTRAIFALLPSLPESALTTATEQAIEKLPDADYPATALPVITNPETHGQVLSILFADLLERPDAITLPALLTIAKNPDHPFAPSALDDLCLLLSADFGSDWSRWDTAIRQKLAAGR